MLHGIMQIDIRVLDEISTDADSDRNSFSMDLMLGSSKRRADPAAYLPYFNFAGVFQESHELLPAVARQEIVCPQLRFQKIRHLDEHRVSGCMPEGIVDALEMIDIDDEQACVSTVLKRFTDKMRGVGLKFQSVRNTRQSIRMRPSSQLDFPLILPLPFHEQAKQQDHAQEVAHNERYTNLLQEEYRHFHWQDEHAEKRQGRQEAKHHQT